jgi:hypothetical protein
MFALAIAQELPVPPEFADLEAYRRDASTKTRAVVDLLSYHRSGEECSPPIDNMKDLPAGDTTPSAGFKAVVYTTFPSTMLPLIRVGQFFPDFGICTHSACHKALKLNEFSVITYTGEDTKKRDSVITTWNKPDGPNILIISVVGMTGINLSAACVMVLVVWPQILSY